MLRGAHDGFAAIPHGKRHARGMSTRKLPPAPPASSHAARLVMTSQRQSDTAPEIALRAELHRRGLRFRKDAAPMAGLRCRADAVFAGPRVAVFVDGCF